MSVMAAGVHHVDVAAEILSSSLGGERQSRRLLHRQRVHIGAQRNNRARLAAAQHGNDAGLGDASPNFEAQLPEMFGNERRRSRFLFAQFRMLVNVAAPGDQLLLDLGGALADFLFQLRDRLRASGRAHRDRKHTKARALWIWLSTGASQAETIDRLSAGVCVIAAGRPGLVCPSDVAGRGDPRAHRFVGHPSGAGLGIVGHVVGIAGSRYRAGDGRMTDDELEQELRPAGAIDLRGPIGEGAAAHLAHGRTARQRIVHDHANAPLRRKRQQAALRRRDPRPNS